MHKFIAAVLTILSCWLVATPANAQATRTWVSGVGDDVNPCSRTAPCKTFAGAISKTAAGGEINCLDPGGFGSLTVTKSITIDCTGVVGSALASAITGFTINAPGGKVTLRNLSINGAGSTPGLNGIRIMAASSVHVTGVAIQGFEGTPGNGIFIEGGSPFVFVSDTDIARNRDGVKVAAAASATVVLDGVSVTANSNNGISADGAKNRIFVSDSVVAGNAVGIAASNGATIGSYGDNRIEANTNPGSFTAPVLAKR